ncbi:ABC transporter ATP-binding protein [Loktanella sp. SALINAS62]|uniref:ABC transporter ATP-binding protein n=1 Tax=Loktanella sp. SALINAS62 TaxID=2706124 RepID=UPI001B8B1B5C|nr:ABC transporter ATP-binding protein [Loktanella sp. SALINAS62]MBS1301413.1 ABC transporter ATP-binding protein [Loktanella sp. SALINAS62]
MTALVEIEDLTVRFSGERTVHAINGVSLSVAKGEVLALLGESGSGKSVTLKSIMQLLPGRRTQIGGRIRFDGRDVLALKGRALADFRGRDVAMIFQDPSLALDPVYSIGTQIAETVIRHEGVSRVAARSRALDMLKRVRIPSAERRLDNYPHEMSGGMRQRAMIALALACGPRLLLADEPTTALDATVQMQVLLLLRELQQEMDMSVIFVTHDIGVAVEIADRVAVMYAGTIVETGTISQIIKDPRHPYTKGLLAANLHGAVKGSRLDAIPGAPPTLEEPPTSCPFAPRCPSALPVCREARPPLVNRGPGRAVACVLEQEPAI